MSYDAVGNVLSRTATEAAVSGQSGTGGSETQNFCYDEQNRLIWASNTAAVPSAGNGTCGKVMSDTLHPKTDPGQLMVYQIRIEGHLGHQPRLPMRI